MDVVQVVYGVVVAMAVITQAGWRHAIVAGTHERNAMRFYLAAARFAMSEPAAERVRASKAIQLGNEHLMRAHKAKPWHRVPRHITEEQALDAVCRA